jgi:phosphate transport system substrate-binding protein
MLMAGSLSLLPLSHLRASPTSTPEHASSEQALAIIVNLSNSVNDLSKSDLRIIFLGQRSHWPNGRRITLVMLESGHPERKALLQEVCQMTEKDYDNRILHGLFTGEVFVSPKTLASPTGVRKFVFNVPGAIGYVRRSDVDETVKVLRIDGRLPEDREYPIHIDQHEMK